MELNNFSIGLLGLLGAATVLQLGYYLLVFARLSLYRVENTVRVQEPVSVIICARNEADNLRVNLPLILDQHYPEFEVVVVNDHSMDETVDLMIDWQMAYKHLKFVNLTDDNSFMEGKKFAVTMGIKGATHDRLLFTDADCKPDGNHWLLKMQGQMHGKRKIVLGYGAYKKLPGLLNLLIRFDTFFIALQYMSYALVGFPYMGVGRNLAYTKDLFFKTKGFIKHRHIKSGDDDLLVNEVATGSNTLIEPQDGSHTVSEPKKTWAGWFTQKRRHLTTGTHYRVGTKLLLGFFMLSQILFYLSVAVGLFHPSIRNVVLGVFIFMLVVKMVCFRPVMRLLGEKDLFLLSPLLEPMMLVFNLVLFVSNKIVPVRRWK